MLADHQFTDLEFDLASSRLCLLADLQTFNGPDTSALRYREAPTLAIQISEEISEDSETYHTDELIGVVAFGCGELPVRPIGEVATLTASQPDSSAWTLATYSQTMTHPIVVMGPPTVQR